MMITGYLDMGYPPPPAPRRRFKNDITDGRSEYELEQLHNHVPDGWSHELEEEYLDYLRTFFAWVRSIA